MLTWPFGPLPRAEYMQVVAKSLKRMAGQWCPDNVKKATDRIVQLLKTTDGYAKVKDTFK